MITEQDLKEAIAECQGTKNPNSNTCIKLAAFYTIYDHLYGKQDIQLEKENYSYLMGSIPEIHGNSEFFDLIEEKGIDKAFPIIEELALTLQVINPRLYDSMMKKISEI
jgi:hypothetical protein